MAFRLHETDTHLGYVRLCLAEGDHAAARDHLAKARALVEATGYHRCDCDLNQIEAMIRDHHLDSLCSLLPSQFQSLVYKLGVPEAYLPGRDAPLATRAADLLRWAEQHGRLDDVERLCREITGRASPQPATPPPPAPAPAATSQPKRAALDDAPVDFLIITALEEERDAILAKLPRYRKLDRDGAGAHTYYEASVATQRKDGAVYRVIATMLSGMGPIKGAIKAGAVIQRWSPEHVLMVGIAGGVSGEAGPGDVIVAEQVADYTLGKVRDTGSRQERWVAYPADADLIDSAKNFPAGWEDLVTCARPESGVPRRKFGVIASGGDVIDSKQQIAIYRQDWPKLIGVEMEGGGVAAGLHDDIARPRFLMVRGVSDLADAENNAAMKAAWRAYACDVAAAYAIGLLRDGPVPAR